MASKIDELDYLFKSYNYSVHNSSNNKVRVYTLRYGMYHAAEIILLDPNYDPTKIKAEFSSLGFATEIKTLDEELNIEEYLFEGFFIKTPLGNELKSRYTQFKNKQLKNLPEDSKYEYIKSSYDLLLQDEDGAIIENRSFNGVTDAPLIKKLNSLLKETDGALFIVLEAAAGFGKTCTAYEVLNTFSSTDAKQLPFFTELSRNREARVFKHILLGEIDEQFPNGIKQNIVIEQITKGRIPLIIDGFDELITKESNKEEVESMLTTIIELLKGNAKIIITSRKTAIFNSDEFIETLNGARNEFTLARIEIKEPTIENWLSKDKTDLLSEFDFPIQQISNPVLLSYIRNIPIDKLKTYVSSPNEDNSLIDKYLDYLLKREQIRQNLKLDSETQLRIFRKLIRFMTEYNITAESKDTIKEFLKDYNIKILQKSIKDYIAEERPSIDDLVETLSNHVFLDRKPNGNIGFINDFIFGLLVAENLVLKKYEEYYPNIKNLLPQDFAQKSVQAFHIQPIKRKKELWNVFNEISFPFDVNFYFNLDNTYVNEFKRDYKNLYINDTSFDTTLFDGNYIFEECGFSNTSFTACHFNLNVFRNCSFHNCNFYNCSLEGGNDKQFNDFGVFACNADNDFLELLSNVFETESDKQNSDSIVELTETLVLSHFFGVGNMKPKARKLSHIKKQLEQFSQKDLSKVISNLKSKEFIYFKDDVGFLSKAGINYFNQHKTELA